MEELIKRIILKGYSIHIEEVEDRSVAITVISNPIIRKNLDVKIRKRLPADRSIEDVLNDIYLMLV
jgi:hypothetical protein